MADNILDAKIETHYKDYSTFEKIDLSHKSHPNLSLIKAMTMSGAIPIIFKAICNDNKCYMDVCFIVNASRIPADPFISWLCDTKAGFVT